MKTMVLMFLSFIIVIGTYAQNSFFSTKPGTVLVYAHKNGKGKVDNYSRQTIKDVEGSGSNMSISYVMEMLDKDQRPSNPPVEVPCKVVIKDDVVVLDMNELFAGMQKEGQPFKVEIVGVPMELPGSMTPGQVLKDANATMTMDMGIMKMRTEIKMTDGKCLVIEEITVPAGTFKCHKITQTTTTTIMKKPIVSKTVSWYALGVGTIKTESYNEKGDLQNSMELASLR